MNSTNRVVNRVFLLVVGALLLAAGSAAVGAALLPRGARPWRLPAVDWRSALTRAENLDLRAIAVPRPVPWFLVAAPVAAAVLIALLLIFVFAQGRGRVGRVADDWHVTDSPAEGFLSVDVAVARDALRRAAAGIRGISTPAVSAYRVAGEPALKLTVSVVDGIDPAAVVPALEAAIAEWDALLGERVPVCVHMTAGVAAGALAPLRVVTGGRREPALVE